ncbi:MAG: dephospho-CoA kinase [Chloroflexota bacterium]
MVVIGLTGGIGSGKSTVAGFLAGMGAVVLDADKVGHEVYRRGTPGWEGVVAAFGNGVVGPDGEIDRRKLAQIAFGSPEMVARLNSVVHPRMYQMMKERIEEWRRHGVAAVVLEAAVLIEAGWRGLVDEVWVTVAPEVSVVRRLKESKGVNEDDTRARIRAQLSTEERKRHADVVIENSGSREELRARVRVLWLDLLRRRGIGTVAPAG